MRAMTERDMLNLSIGESLPSSEALSIVGICVDEETWRFLGIFANTTRLIRLVSRTTDYQGLDHDGSENAGPLSDICLVDFDRNRRGAAMAAERIRAASPGTALFAISSQSHPDSILEAMRSGCSEYLTKPIQREQLVNALARIGARRREQKEQSKAQVMAFIGSKGGCGVTTLVTQLGAILANSYSRKTMVVDFHSDFGDAALYLKLTKPAYHFFELCENTHRLDSDFLQGFLMQHSSGVDLIAAPEGSDSTRELLPGAISQTFDFLRLRYDFILVDLPVGLNERNLELIRHCDQLYVVTVAEVSAIRNVIRQFEHFTRAEIPHDKVHVVLNRYQKRGLISDAQIEKAIQQKIYWRVPNHYPQVVKTIHEGDPVAQLSSSEVGRNLKEWAGLVGKKPDENEKKKESGGILGFWNR
jgi:pilus assembly protein CpaE